ncbi:peptidase S8/S53 domain-containing protein [Rhodocollybia butyracea]|uniref:Peptidase S8/S53 domain-containing protein n=1 Tax=Rhodocollybia butyracea TaxID=206335 RepID=A0A9P5Q9W7_9AGAR|nr:peptidase S8/S53 domain-containing protein [Rhodocollybia butyracea]
MSLHDRRDSIPNGYTQIGVATDDTILHMRINIEMGNRTGLEDALNKASDPSHEKYGQWLSQEDIQYYAAPTREALHSVRKWLSSNNIDSQSTTVSGDWIKFNVSVGTANTMLNAKYSIFEYTASGKQAVRTLEYSVPEDLREYIKAIHPASSGHHHNIGSASNDASEKASSSSTSSASLPTSTAQFSHCNETVTPACIQKLYGLPTTSVSSNTNSTIGVSGYSGQDANKADLTAFLKLFKPDIPSSTTFGTELLDDATNSQNNSEAGMEANLDIQYTIGLANGIPTTFFDVGNTNLDGDDGGFLDIINDLLAERNPPLVLTTSYGVAGDESGLSRPLTFAMCDAFMKLTARGVSILYATGDGGVASSPGGECDDTPFLAAWPTCPYLQQNAVATYLDKIDSTLYKGRYNRAGRGFPDVSAQGEKIQIIESGAVTTVAGTSASSPIFAAIVALLNDELLSAGKPPLGFLNPWIYAHPEAFNDITSGSNYQGNITLVQRERR